MAETEGKPDPKSQVLALDCSTTRFRDKKGKFHTSHGTGKQQGESKKTSWMSQREIWNQKRHSDRNPVWNCNCFPMQAMIVLIRVLWSESVLMFGFSDFRLGKKLWSEQICHSFFIHEGLLLTHLTRTCSEYYTEKNEGALLNKILLFRFPNLRNRLV